MTSPCTIHHGDKEWLCADDNNDVNDAIDPNDANDAPLPPPHYH